MFLNINPIRCLIVEDDPFKMEGVRDYLKEILFERVEIVECQALSTAATLLSSLKFHLAILDMSIHSHEPEAGAGSPFPLSSGGLDVLFEIESLGTDTHCIILTQYPDIEIDGSQIPVELARQEILEKFEICVAGCVRYLESDTRWKDSITSILESL